MKISKHSARHFLWGAGCEGWSLVEQTQLTIIQHKMPPGTSEVGHLHRTARQFVFVLSGTASLEIDDRREILEAQEGFEIAPQVAHRICNRSEHDLEFLVISQPSSQADRVLVERSSRLI